MGESEEKEEKFWGSGSKKVLGFIASNIFRENGGRENARNRKGNTRE